MSICIKAENPQLDLDKFVNSGYYAKALINTYRDDKGQIHTFIKCPAGCEHEHIQPSGEEPGFWCD